MRYVLSSGEGLTTGEVREPERFVEWRRGLRTWRDGDASEHREGADDEQDLSGAIFERGDRQHHVIGIGRAIDATDPQGIRRAGPGQRHEGNQDNKKAERRHTNAPTMDVIDERGEGLAWQPSQQQPPRAH